jgi:RNA polymerase sigma-70 factor (ECF subfamily)
MSAATSTFTRPSRPLLPLVAAGDHRAMHQVVCHFTPLVRSIARRAGGGPSHADDLVQETMLRLWRSAHRFDPARGGEPTFVAAVARHAAIDMARRRASRPAIPTAEPDELAPPVPAWTDQVANVVTVRAAVATLRPTHRELVRLAYFEQLTQREIADRLDLPIGTVKSRTFQALRELRTALAGIDG